jgi:hypothetical protein
MHNDLPRLQRPVTAQVHRVLLTHPAWIGQWLALRPQVALLPSHCDELSRVIGQINRLEPAYEEYDDLNYNASFLAFPEFFDSLLNLAKLNLVDQRIFSDVFLILLEIRQCRQLLFESISSQLQDELTVRQTRNLLSLIVSIASHVNMDQLFEVASRTRLRGHVDIARLILKVAKRNRSSASSPLFPQFVSFFLFTANEDTMSKVLPTIQRSGIPELSEVFHCYVERMAQQVELSAPFVRFLSLLTNPEFVADHESVLLPILSRLISCGGDGRLIDRLFGCLGRDRKDIPQDIDCDGELSSFWRLVSESREFLSERVDEHPRLLDGPYQFLTSAQSLLGFSVRLKFFRRKMQQKKTRKDFAIHVRRENVLQDSFVQLMKADNRSWLGRLHVTFTNEPGVDGGGLLKEWFSCLTRELFNPGYALFLPTLSERSFQPNPGSGINPRHLAYFHFTGRIFALAILNSVYLSTHLSTPFLKLLIGKSVSLEDLKDIDDVMFRGMKWILDNPVGELPSQLMFTTSSSEIGSSSEIELKENGASIIVTDENKKEYIELVVDHRLKGAILSQAAAFCQGFHEFISRDELSVFGPHELDSVICGENIIDIDDWQTNCEFQGGYSAQHPVIAMFFSVLRKWSQENLAKLMAFATGSPQVPLGGFAAFREAGRPMIINCGGEKTRLATAHTCENRLDLPKYENEDEMNDRLLYAVENCSGFGMR